MGEVLEAAERLFRTFSGHPYDRALSEEVMEVLAECLPEEPPYEYGRRLAWFTNEHRLHIEHAYSMFGPTSEHYRLHGLCVLVAQPESLIMFERLTNGRLLLQHVWEDQLPEQLLEDVAKAWGVAL